MVQWFKKKKKYETVEFNTEALEKRASKILKELYEYKNSQGVSLLLEYIRLYKNNEILKVGESANAESLWFRKGRLSAVRGLLEDFDVNFQEANDLSKAEAKRPKGQVKIAGGNIAGPAM